MIGTYLKSYMENQGIKQRFVSEKTGICLEKLGDMLDGQRKMEIAEYYDICAAMGANPTQLALESRLYVVTEQK